MEFSTTTAVVAICSLAVLLFVLRVVRFRTFRRPGGPASAGQTPHESHQENISDPLESSGSPQLNKGELPSQASADALPSPSRDRSAKKRRNKIKYVDAPDGPSSQATADPRYVGPQDLADRPKNTPATDGTAPAKSAPGEDVKTSAATIIAPASDPYADKLKKGKAEPVSASAAPQTRMSEEVPRSPVRTDGVALRSPPPAGKSATKGVPAKVARPQPVKARDPDPIDSGSEKSVGVTVPVISAPGDEKDGGERATPPESPRTPPPQQPVLPPKPQLSPGERALIASTTLTISHGDGRHKRHTSDQDTPRFDLLPLPVHVAASSNSSPADSICGVSVESPTESTELSTTDPTGMVGDALSVVSCLSRTASTTSMGSVRVSRADKPQTPRQSMPAGVPLRTVSSDSLASRKLAQRTPSSESLTSRRMPQRTASVESLTSRGGRTSGRDRGTGSPPPGPDYASQVFQQQGFLAAARALGDEQAMDVALYGLRKAYRLLEEQADERRRRGRRGSDVSSKDGGAQKTGVAVCSSCGGVGHWGLECRGTPSHDFSSNVCEICWGRGHGSRTCANVLRHRCSVCGSMAHENRMCGPSFALHNAAVAMEQRLAHHGLRGPGTPGGSRDARQAMAAYTADLPPLALPPHGNGLGVVEAGSLAQPGDWICECGAVNWVHRLRCEQCDTTKPDNPRLAKLTSSSSALSLNSPLTSSPGLPSSPALTMHPDAAAAAYLEASAALTAAAAMVHQPGSPFGPGVFPSPHAAGTSMSPVYSGLGAGPMYLPFPGLSFGATSIPTVFAPPGVMISPLHFVPPASSDLGQQPPSPSAPVFPSIATSPTTSPRGTRPSSPAQDPSNTAPFSRPRIATPRSPLATPGSTPTRTPGFPARSTSHQSLHQLMREQQTQRETLKQRPRAETLTQHPRKTGIGSPQRSREDLFDDSTDKLPTSPPPGMEPLILEGQRTEKESAGTPESVSRTSDAGSTDRSPQRGPGSPVSVGSPRRRRHRMRRIEVVDGPIESLLPPAPTWSTGSPPSPGEVEAPAPLL